MRWSDIDLDRGDLDRTRRRGEERSRARGTTFRTGTRYPPVSLPRFVGSDLVFTTTGTTPISGFGRLKDRLDGALGVSDWRFHDLRRTAVSGMARIGVGPHVIEKVLNHQSGVISGVAAVYNRHGYEVEKREAMERWAEHVEPLDVFRPRVALYRGSCAQATSCASGRAANQARARAYVGGSKVETLTGRDVAILVADVAERAPVLANRVLSTTRRLFGWAIGQGLIHANPCDRIERPTTERGRQRVLSTSEIRSMWRALDDPTWGALFRLCLLTAQRLSCDECIR